MKWLFPLLIASVATILACQLAHAAQLELGVGITRFQQRNDCATWVQCAPDGSTPYSDHLTSPSLKIGATDTFSIPFGILRNQRFRWHAGYEYLGHVSVNAIAYTGPDHVYSGYPRATFDGSGYVQGFYGTVEWLHQIRSWTLGLGAGGYVFRSYWTEYMGQTVIPPLPPGESIAQIVHHQPVWQNSPTLSLSLSRGNNEFELTYLAHITGNISPSNPYPPYYDMRRVNVLGHQFGVGPLNITWTYRFGGF